MLKIMASCSLGFLVASIFQPPSVASISSSIQFLPATFYMRSPRSFLMLIFLICRSTIMALCYLHQKQRTLENLQEAPPGSGKYTCLEGNACKVRPSGGVPTNQPPATTAQGDFVVTCAKHGKQRKANVCTQVSFSHT